jgi:AraC-like DNA-binding protein
VWQGNRLDIADSFVGTPYMGNLPLVEASKKIAQRDFIAKQPILSELMQWFIDAELVVPNLVTEKILNHIADVHTVADMAAVSGLSSRQLQRTLKQTTGFTPHDLLKVLRMQQSFKQHYLDLYADQSHFIHSFRKITGYTPAKYVNKFDV